jgi:hypothetical protein
MFLPKLHRFAQLPTAILAVSMVVLGIAVVWILANGRSERLPKPVVQSAALRISEQRCAECHSEITDNFGAAPHSRTLTRASDGVNAGLFDGRTFHNEINNVDFQYRLDNDRLVITSPAYARPLMAEWIFGSGTHARTPLITWTDLEGELSGIEHSVSWYPKNDLGVTLGLEKLKESEGILAMGNPRPSHEVTGCFGCHSTFVSMEGKRLNPHQLEPGIGCVRCHWNAAEHVRTIDLGLSSTPERLSQLTPLESVNRCGECHRRADELSGEIRPEDNTLVRFASVGLVQSKCFLEQDSLGMSSGAKMRLDCVSCHNPHQPASSDWKTHTAVCAKCHDGSRPEHVHCPTSQPADNCLDCHMPKVPSNPHLSFTDHWIRVRRDQN